MNTPTLLRRFIAVSLLVLASTISMAATESAVVNDPVVNAVIEVSWNDPATLTETRRSHGRFDAKDAEAVLGKLADHLRKRGERFLPEGQQLSVTLVDIDLAGDFEPWRGTYGHDIRIVKDIYPPRIDLRFTLSDAQGNTLREGESSLRDPGFLTRSGASASDGLRFEKRLLDDWLRSEFGTTQRR